MSIPGFINPAVYDIGLTSGGSVDLYSLCFHDINDGGTNANGFGPGFKTVSGYDLCTGWGSPTAALIDQLATLKPLTPNQPLGLIRFVIKTGGDGLRGNGNGNGTGITADVILKDNSQFAVTLHSMDDPAGFENDSTHTLDFQIPDTVNPPLTPSHGIAGVRINIQEHYSFPATADNWNIVNLSVSLFNNPNGPFACQLNPKGTNQLQDGDVGLVRLSENADNSGSGPSSQIFPTGPGSGVSAHEEGNEHAASLS